MQQSRESAAVGCVVIRVNDFFVTCFIGVLLLVYCVIIGCLLEYACHAE